MKPSGLKKERIEAVSDGVIAVAITLMFLGFESSYEEIRDAASSQEIWSFIASEWPKFASYCLSFVLVGVYWLQHHVIFHYVGRADRIFIALNLLFLMSIAMVPVAADWLVESLLHEHVAIFVFYAGTNIVVSLLLLALWVWATTGRRLVTDDLDQKTVQSIAVEVLQAPAVCVLGGLICPFSIKASTAILLSMPLLYLWPRKSDARWWEVSNGRRHDPGAKPTESEMSLNRSRVIRSQATLPEGVPTSGRQEPAF